MPVVIIRIPCVKPFADGATMSEKDNYYAEYCDQPEKQNAALGVALSNRQFEIEHYWKRTTYFWTLTAAALTGYFALTSPKSPAHAAQFYPFCIGCMGLLISVSWFFANKGSKFWQENWENHVDSLGDPEMGPLFKKILTRPKKDRRWYEVVTWPSKISVSKLNQWVSLYVILFWLGLIGASSPFAEMMKASCIGRHPFGWTFAGTVIFAIVMVRYSATSLEPHKPDVVYVSSEIGN